MTIFAISEGSFRTAVKTGLVDGAHVKISAIVAAGAEIGSAGAGGTKGTTGLAQCDLLLVDKRDGARRAGQDTLSIMEVEGSLAVSAFVLVKADRTVIHARHADLALLAIAFGTV